MFAQGRPGPATPIPRAGLRSTSPPSSAVPWVQGQRERENGVPSAPGRSPQPGSPLRPTEAAKGRLAAWPLSDSRHKKGRFTSSTGGSGVAGTEACTRGRSAPATPRDVADRTGANGPERAATDNMATASPNAEPVTGTTFRPRRRRRRRKWRAIRDVSAPAQVVPEA